MKIFLREKATPYTVKADIAEVQGMFLVCFDTSADEAHPYKSTTPKQRRVAAMFQTKDVEAVLYRDKDDAVGE